MSTVTKPGTKKQDIFYFDAEFTGEGCRVLYLEVLRRAMYDYVLYRNSSKLSLRIIAQEAHFWLFEEESRGLLAAHRRNQNRSCTSFLNLCAALGLDPKEVRERARTMTAREVLNLGRPRLYRKPKKRKEETQDAHDSSEVLHLSDLRAAARAQPPEVSSMLSRYWG